MFLDVDVLQCSLGKAEADVVVKNAIVIDTWSGELLEGYCLAVKNGVICRLDENVDDVVGRGTTVLEAKGKYLSPGFMDAHVHLESSMLSVSEFCRAVVPRGTTCAVADPHEIANVLGVRGIKLLMREARNLPLKVLFSIPSCVPASDMETSGATIGIKEVVKLTREPEVVALGEMMNYVGVVSLNQEVLAKLEAAQRSSLFLDGHAPRLRGAKLSAYVAAGIRSDHEVDNLEEGLEKLRKGMYLMVREGSLAKNISSLAGVAKSGIDLDACLVVSDDRTPKDLAKLGHMDHNIKRLIEEGFDPVDAYKMATLNPAKRYGLENVMGSPTPGRIADFVLLDDLEKVKVSKVFVDGELVASNGKLMVELPKFAYPKYALNTVKLKKKLAADDFSIRAPRRSGEVSVRVIEVADGSLVTGETVEKLPIKDRRVIPSVEKDVLQVAVVERHGKTGNVGLGFVKGFGLKRGALASTVAHDSHNLVVVGASWEDMLSAVEEVQKMQGGLAVVSSGKTLAKLELPIAGLMSTERLESVVEKHENLEKAAKKLGCKLEQPFMTLSFIALPVIPKLKITDFGLVDVEKQEIISVFA